MKTYNIESRVTRIETIQVMAHSRKEAISKAESKEFVPNWVHAKDEERQLVSIS